LLGIAPDDAGALRAMLAEADACDVILLSGGTSKGEGDLSYRVLAGFAEVVVHGVALKPGKPLCLAHRKGKPVVVLPGFPTSAIFTFHAFVAPVLRRLMGLGDASETRLRARLARHLKSEAGREEYTLVSLVPGRDGLLAVPLGKGSGSVTTFARADGFFAMPAAQEYAEAEEPVEVTLLGQGLLPADLVVVGSQCTGLDRLLSVLAGRGLRVKTLEVGSRGGLEAAKEGACDVAPVHLYDRATDRYNEPFLAPGLRLLAGYGRRQGLAFRREHAAALGPDAEAKGVADTMRRAAADPALRLANRNAASGTRALLEDVLGDLRPPGFSTGYRSHPAVATAIAQRRADWGLCLEAPARAVGLLWRPLKDERYDFLVPEDRWDRPGTRAFRALLEERATGALLASLGFVP
jgi:putative molybdopterin biosynthesis protein